MKQTWKLGLLSLLFLIAFSSCTKETQEEEECANSACRVLVGEWNLMSHSAGLAGSENYDKDDVTWTFNGDGTVDVLINVTLTNSYMPIKTSQTVNYVMNGTEITVDNGRYDFTVDGSKLTLSDHPELDGPVIFFERD
jgi:hypothetical protein